MSANSYTCKIPVLNSDSLCILNSEWLNTEINFLFLHDNKAWSGKFQLIENEFITDLLDQLSISEDSYLKESRKALTTHGGVETFTYSLENEKFTWKKQVRKEMSVKYGSVDLLKVPLFESFEKIIDNTLHSNLTYVTKLQDVDNQRESLEKENHNLKSKLNDLIEKKNEMETTLYSQFLHLLNEKKRKIKEMRTIMAAEGNADPMKSENNHFDSDTEIDSEDEEKISFEGSSLDIEDEPVILPKRSRQKRPIDSIAGPSGETFKVKNSKVVQPKKQVVSTRKGQRKSGKDSCVMGQFPKEKETTLSEGSEDAFAFKKDSKKTVALKPITRKILYESDEDTDLDKTQSQISQDKNVDQITNVEKIQKEADSMKPTTSNVLKESDSDVDKTPSDIEIYQVDSNNKIINPESTEKKQTKNKGLKRVTEAEKAANSITSEELKKESVKLKVAKKTGYPELSTSTLQILNQLV